MFAHFFLINLTEDIVRIAELSVYSNSIADFERRKKFMSLRRRLTLLNHYPVLLWQLSE